MTIRMYGAEWCSDCKRAKLYFDKQGVEYEYIDIDDDAKGISIVRKANKGRRIIPTIFFEDGSILVEPSNAELAAKIGLNA
jgi:thioredoxin reductase (NADPH)